MARVGRPSKPYPSSWGDDILGLTKCGDGRWRCTVNGKEVRFSEENERRAVERFNEMTGKTKAVEWVAVEMKPSADGGRMLVAVPRFLEAIAAAGVKLTGKSRSFASDPPPSIIWGNRVDIGYDLDPEIVWPWVCSSWRINPRTLRRGSTALLWPIPMLCD